MFKKNTAVTGFPIGHFIQTADGAAKTTGTPTCKRLLDGTGGDCANAASYNATAGVWEIDLDAADMNGDMVGLVFTLADCLPISYAIRTSENLVGVPQTGDSYARLGAPAGASVSADIADVPTVAEFEARTLPSADYTVVSDLPSVPSAADIAAAILVTPANLLLTDAAGRVEIAGTTNNTLDSVVTALRGAGWTDETLASLAATLTAIKGAGWTDETLASLDVSIDAVKAVTDRVASMLEEDGAAHRFTAEALAEAPSGTVQASLSISATEAESVAEGELAIATYHEFRQTIISTSTDDLSTAVLALGIKVRATDADTAALLLVRSDTGLSRVNGAAYATPAHGTLTVSGSSGDWDITMTVTAAVAGLLEAYSGRELASELKNLTTDRAIWTGVTAVTSGIVKATS